MYLYIEKGIRIRMEFMYSERRKVYSDDLVKVTTEFKKKTKEIIAKLGEDNIINQGLFIMSTTLFEDSIRKIMRIILISFPEKLKVKSCAISKKQVCDIADKGIEVIIDNELYALFREGVKEQLEYLFHIVSNYCKSDLSEDITILIRKCADISLYRNSIIHNGGRPTDSLLMNANIYKINPNLRSEYNRELFEVFLNDYLNIFNSIESEIKKHFRSYTSITRVQKLRDLWYECFKSPLLKFEEYWGIDFERDLITDIKHPNYENSLSSSEKVILSIWRHQYYDGIKTEEFLLCSVNYETICKLYKGLAKTQFYYMYQQSRRKY